MLLHLLAITPATAAPPTPLPAAAATKSRQALYRRLGLAAARAAALGLGDAEFGEACQLLGELVAAARSGLQPLSRHSQHDKAWGVLQGCEAAHLTALLCDYSAADLRRLLAALQRDLGWSAPQAAAALLGWMDIPAWLRRPPMAWQPWAACSGAVRGARGLSLAARLEGSASSLPG